MFKTLEGTFFRVARLFSSGKEVVSGGACRARQVVQVQIEYAEDMLPAMSVQLIEPQGPCCVPMGDH